MSDYKDGLDNIYWTIIYIYIQVEKLLLNIQKVITINY